MALLHADNFSIYGSTAQGGVSNMLDGVYAQADNAKLVIDPDGISTGYVVEGDSTTTGGGLRLRYVLESLTATIGIGLRFWTPSLPVDTSYSQRMFVFQDVSNATLAWIQNTPTGRLQAVKGDGTIYDTTTAPVITAAGWYHLEVKAVQGGAGACTIELRVEGIPVLSLTGLTFNNTNNVAQVSSENHASGSGAGTIFYIKDFVVWDGTGSLNNDFLGSVLVHNLNPTSDVSLNWTPSTGTTGYNILSDIPPVDTTYISAPYNAGGPPFYPDPYVGTLSDLPVETTTVKGIITFVRAAKSDGGDGSLQVGVISDPSGAPATALGADRPITVAQTYWRDVFETDPKTSAPWLPSAVNAAEIQINRTT